MKSARVKRRIGVDGKKHTGLYCEFEDGSWSFAYGKCFKKIKQAVLDKYS